ncbi:hypothetical protein D3C72_1913710 [compost metagenome]
MNGWPAIADIEPILTIVPCVPSRRITLTASCIRKNGARTLTANMRSKSSGLVSRMVPRSVIAAALTSASTRPNLPSQALTTLRASSTFSRSAST